MSHTRRHYDYLAVHGARISLHVWCNTIMQLSSTPEMRSHVTHAARISIRHAYQSGTVPELRAVHKVANLHIGRGPDNDNFP